MPDIGRAIAQHAKEASRAIRFFAFRQFWRAKQIRHRLLILQDDDDQKQRHQQQRHAQDRIISRPWQAELQPGFGNGIASDQHKHDAPEPDGGIGGGFIRDR